MFLLFVIAGLLQAPEVRLTTLDGQVHSGALLQLNSDSATVAETTGEIIIPVSRILAMDLPGPAGANSDTMPPTNAAADEALQQVRLQDGSVINGKSVARSGQQLTIQTDWLGVLQVGAAAVRSVRLHSDHAKYSAQWDTFLQRESEKDLLVIPKSDGEGLDFLAGIVSTIGPQQIAFLLDGEEIPVPAERVYGVVFAKTAVRPAESAITLYSRTGQQIAVRTVTLNGARIAAESALGHTLDVAVADVRRIDFSSGRLRYLSDLEPIAEVFSGIDPPGSPFAGLIDPPTAKLMYGPRRDTTIDPAHRIRLRGKVYSKGLCLHSRTELRYALDRKFTTLEALVGVDDLVAFNQNSKVALRITGDGDVLYEKTFETSEAAVPLKLNVAQVATLSILVDFADNDSSCDWLDLADAKLILAADTQ